MIINAPPMKKLTAAQQDRAFHLAAIIKQLWRQHHDRWITWAGSNYQVLVSRLGDDGPVSYELRAFSWNRFELVRIEELPRQVFENGVVSGKSILTVLEFYSSGGSPDSCDWLNYRPSEDAEDWLLSMVPPLDALACVEAANDPQRS